jgi:hypothetical protein
MNDNINLLKKMYDLCSKEEYIKIKEGKQYSEEDLNTMHNMCKTSSYLIINTQKNLTSDFCAKILKNYNYIEREKLIVDILYKQKHISIYDLEKSCIRMNNNKINNNNNSLI